MTKLKPKRSVGPLNAVTVAEALERYAAPAGGVPSKVQLLRLFSVFSKNVYSSPIMHPIGLAYVAAVVEGAGYDVDIIDAVGENVFNIYDGQSGLHRCQGMTPDQIVKRVNDDTAILGVSMMFSLEWVEHRETIKRIKAAHPDVVIVAGGEHPTAMPEYVLRDCPAIDFVVTGEGELSFLDLLQRIVTGAPVAGLPGVSYLENGAFKSGGPGRRIADFENLPRPAWHLFPVESYFNDTWTSGISFGRNMPVLATRGCPFQCTFCSNPNMWTTRYVMRDPARVVDEIQWLMTTYGANSIDFADLTAIVKKEWVIEFCQELERRGVHVPWQLPSGTRSEALDTETLEAIYRANCRFLVYAPESGSEETLKLIKKKLKLQNLVASVKKAVRIGHTVKINLVIAFPDETRRSMLKTFLFGIRMGLAGADDMNIAIFSPYPGSELFNLLRERGELPVINDKYFNDLLVQFDFTVAKVYCKNVFAREAVIYRTVGMSLFYIISYLVRPRRLLHLVKGILAKDFRPHSLFEQRVCDLLRRKSLNKSGHRQVQGT